MKKGFTLLELLAVIIILGVIALIAVPIVNNITAESKKGVFKTSVTEIARAIKENCELELLDGKELTTLYVFTSDGVSPSLEVKGKLPTSGSITVDDKCNTSFSNVTDGNYIASKELNSDTVIVSNNIPDEQSKICRATHGNGSNIGDVITCGTESFYVYATSGDNIKMIAKYNLKVGGIYDVYTDVYTPYSESEMTYLQDENMKGHKPELQVRYGTTVFSSNSKKGTNYSSYEGSIVEGYVDKYREKLEEIGVNFTEVTLITKQELETLGCNVSEKSCSETPDFIRETTYWSRTPNKEGFVWRVFSDGGYHYSTYEYNKFFGVRPVVIISKSDI